MASLRNQGKTFIEIGIELDISRSRVQQILKKITFKADKEFALEKSRNIIRSSPDLHIKKWAISEILNGLDIKGRTKNSIASAYKDSVTLQEFVDHLISGRCQSDDLGERVPAYRLKHIGSTTLRMIVEEIKKCDFSPEFNKFFARRVQEVHNDLYGPLA